MQLICNHKKIFVLFFMIWSIVRVAGQDYRAMHGSSYGGSLSVANNPATIVHVPYDWDFTPLAIQFKHSTNALVVKNSSYLSPAKKSTEVFLKNGEYKSFVMANQDIRLLNASIRISDNSAIAFGTSLRSYLSAKTSSLVFEDSIGRSREFMGNNISNTPASAHARGHAWAEIFGTFAKTIVDNGNSIINAGITVKTNIGIAGGYVSGTGIQAAPGLVNNNPGYYLTNGFLNYGTSANMDVLDSSSTYDATTRKEFFKRTFSAIGISLGVEYILPKGAAGNGYEHDLKIGLSLLDIGANRFQYSGYSRTAILDKNNVSDSLIDYFFDNVYDVASLSDSLDLISGSNSPIGGKFNIFQPARLVLNVDKHIFGNLFINGELTLPLHKLLDKKKLVATDMNFINLAARIETPKIGLYFPVSLNSQMHFWVGSAFRVGSFLFGIHNWASVIGSNKIQDGGAYLALTLRFGDRSRSGGTSGILNSGKALKQSKCPPSVF